MIWHAARSPGGGLCIRIPEDEEGRRKGTLALTGTLTRSDRDTEFWVGYKPFWARVLLQTLVQQKTCPNDFSAHVQMQDSLRSSLPCEMHARSF